jgi:hypothetical protein
MCCCIPIYKHLPARSDPIYFCFDAETKPKTAQAVYTATLKTGNLLTEAGCNVQVVRLPLLPGTDKTGVDDFLVAQAADQSIADIATAWQATSAIATPELVINGNGTSKNASPMRLA